MRVPTRRYDEKRQALDPYLTKDRYNELKDKLDHLKKVTRLRLMKEVATLAEHGDFSENAAYQIAKGRLRSVNDAIYNLEEHLKKAIIISGNKNQDKVAIGSKVTVLVDGVEKIFTILGSSELDLSKNIISHNSPLGLALLNARVGDEISLAKKRYKIVKIN